MSLEKKRVKKLVTVLTISSPVTLARKKGVEDSENLRSILTRVPCIHYLIKLREKSVLVLFNLGSKVNVIHLTFAKELSLFIRATDVKAQKIDGTILDIYGMVVAAFLMTDKAN